MTGQRIEHGASGTSETPPQLNRRPTPQEPRMDREQILDLYHWADGICFRHPGQGEQPTTPVGVIHPREDGEREIRACKDCVVTMEDIRREEAARSGREYEPGHLGEVLG